MVRKRPNGFTLPEMMMSLAVFSIMMVVVGMILQGGEEQTQLAGNKMNLQETVRESLYRINLKIRETAPDRVCVGADTNQCINPGSSIRFCIPSPANPVNSSRCTGNCDSGIPANNQCEYQNLNDCVSKCNQAWDATWKTICNIDCNSACSGYCNADYKINWKDSVRVQFGANNGQFIRTDTIVDLIRGQPTATQTVEANDIQNVTFTPQNITFNENKNLINTIGLSVTAQPTLNRTSLLKGRVLSVTSSNEAKIRNP